MSGFDESERAGMRIRSVLLTIIFVGLIVALIVQGKMESRVERTLREQLGDAKEQVLMLRDELAELSQLNSSLEKRLELAHKRAERAEAKLVEQEESKEPARPEEKAKAEAHKSEPDRKNEVPKAEEKR